MAIGLLLPQRRRCHGKLSLQTGDRADSFRAAASFLQKTHKSIWIIKLYKNMKVDSELYKEHKLNITP